MAYQYIIALLLRHCYIIIYFIIIMGIMSDSKISIHTASHTGAT